MFRVK